MDEVIITIDKAPPNAVGVGIRSRLVSTPRQGDGAAVGTLGGLEVLQEGAAQQACRQLVTLERVLTDGQLHLVGIACGDIGQTLVSDSRKGARLGIGIGSDRLS